MADNVMELFGDVNTMWVLIAAALVFLMQAGFAMVETGFTRAKNAGNIIMKNLMDFAIGTPLYWLVGFGIMFGTQSAVFGGIFAQNCSLCLNAHAVAVALIVTAEAHIHCCVVNFRLLQIYLLCAKQPALTEPLYRKRGLHATI